MIPAPDLEDRQASAILTWGRWKLVLYGPATTVIAIGAAVGAAACWALHLGVFP